MKLSRNKIRKIRKQQHQSVRKWKKHHKSARRSTFRQSRRQNMTGVMTKYPSKLNSVVNRTLKKYISLPELEQIKEKYKKIRRMRRKQKHYKMIGGEEGQGGIQMQETNTAPPAPAPAAKSAYSPEDMNTIIQTVVTAAVTAALKANSDAKPPATNVADPKATTTVNNQPTAAPVSNNGEDAEANADTSKTTETGAVSGTSQKDGKKQPFSLGPEVKGDISIGVEVHECKNKDEVWKLVQFLIQKGLPYYIQIELKTGDKPLNKNDTNIFDLRRILYGKFTQDIKKIQSDKRKLYIEAKETVGIANGDTFGVDQPGLFIYTGEKGQVLKESTDSSIKVRILQEDKNAAPSILTDSKRLYKIKGKDADVKPASIDTVAFLQKLDSKNKIDTSEFRLQIAPMTPDELNKDAQNIAAGNDNPDVKVVVDESNTYVVNLEVGELGCKITSVQTLKKSLERARASLENEKDQTKTSAMEILKMLNALMENPEFMKNDGYADFKEQVYGFSYKIRGSERKYSFTQMQTFLDDNKESLPPGLAREFLKLMKLLGHGPNGANGECERFDGASPSVWELSRIQTFEEDGKIVTKKTDTLDSASNVKGFAKQFSNLGQAAKENETKENTQSGSSSASLSGSSDSSETSSTKPSTASTSAAAATVSVVASTLQGR